MNPAYESDDDNDSLEYSKRKDTAPAIQSTVLPWKQSSYKDDEADRGSSETFSSTMSKPVKQQEFPPNWHAQTGTSIDDTKSSSGNIKNNNHTQTSF